MEPATEDKLKGLRISAVVPSAGHGERMGSETPKQYIEVCGRPLIEYCVTSLVSVDWISEVVLVAEDKVRMTRIFPEGQKKSSKVLIVEAQRGSVGRHRSIWAGLEALRDLSPDLVIIQDGVRPIIPIDVLTQVTLKALEHKAAGVTCPLVSTVVAPDASNLLLESLDRSRFFNSEMPQAFHYRTILEGYRKCPPKELDCGTECLAIAMNYGGVRPYLLRTSHDLWKVTYPRDLIVSESVISLHFRRTALISFDCHHATSEKPNTEQGHQGHLTKAQTCPSMTNVFAAAKKVSLMNSYEVSELRLPLQNISEHQTAVVLSCIDKLCQIEDIFRWILSTDKEGTQTLLVILCLQSPTNLETRWLRTLAKNSKSQDLRCVCTLVIKDWEEDSKDPVEKSARIADGVSKIMESFLSRFSVSLHGQILHLGE